MGENKPNRPVTYKIAYYYDLIFAGIFIVYGAVKIILGILDRMYADIALPVLSLLIGVIFMSLTLAFKDLKKWGWYGLIVINALVIILALFDIGRYENVILMLLSAIALFALFSSSVRSSLKA